MNVREEEWLNTEQVYEILRDAGVTNSKQMVRRWLSNKAIPGAWRTPNRKNGWRAPMSGVLEFIQKRKPEREELERLQVDVAMLQEQLNSAVEDRDELSKQLTALENAHKRIVRAVRQPVMQDLQEPTFWLLKNRSGIKLALDVMTNFSQGLNEAQILDVYRVLRDHAGDITHLDEQNIH